MGNIKDYGIIRRVDFFEDNEEKGYTVVQYLLLCLYEGLEEDEELDGEDVVMELLEFSISSVDVKSNKPDSAHFIKAKEISGIEFINTLHIGDHPINDVKGARDLGISTMWFNSQNLTWDVDDNPPLMFNHWSQFMNLLSLHHEQ